MNAFPAAVTITGCVFTIMLVCQDVYHSNVMLNTACVLVTGVELYVCTAYSFIRR